jgi:hypothetical protein
MRPLYISVFFKLTLGIFYNFRSLINGAGVEEFDIKDFINP